MMKSKWLAGVVAVLSGIYLLNPGAGFLGELPDNLPVLGNLDEATVTALLIWAISVLRGKPVHPPKTDGKPGE